MAPTSFHVNFLPDMFSIVTLTLGGRESLKFFKCVWWRTVSGKGTKTSVKISWMERGYVFVFVPGGSHRYFLSLDNETPCGAKLYMLLELNSCQKCKYKYWIRESNDSLKQQKDAFQNSVLGLQISLLCYLYLYYNVPFTFLICSTQIQKIITLLKVLTNFNDYCREKIINYH